MNVGMLWFDNDSKSDLTSKVEQAASYYKGKYGDQPNICFIHPSMASKVTQTDNEDQKFEAGEIEVCLSTSVLPHHFWIGKQLES